MKKKKIFSNRRKRLSALLVCVMSFSVLVVTLTSESVLAQPTWEEPDEPEWEDPEVEYPFGRPEDEDAPYISLKWEDTNDRNDPKIVKPTVLVAEDEFEQKKGMSVLVEATILDDGEWDTGIDHSAVEIRVGSGPWRVMTHRGGSQYGATVNVTVGKKVIKVQATDNSGNKAEVDFSINVVLPTEGNGENGEEEEEEEKGPVSYEKQASDEATVALACWASAGVNMMSGDVGGAVSNVGQAISHGANAVIAGIASFFSPSVTYGTV